MHLTGNFSPKLYFPTWVQAFSTGRYCKLKLKEIFNEFQASSVGLLNQAGAKVSDKGKVTDILQVEFDTLYDLLNIFFLELCCPV